MNIALGSLVICKILMVNPVIEKKADGLNSYNLSTNTTIQRMVGKPEVTKSTNKESFVVGVVEEIKSRRRLVEVENNKKFVYKDYHTLLIKSESLERLVIGSESCETADKMIVSQEKNEIKKETVAPVKKETSKNTVKIDGKEFDLNEYEVVVDESLNALHGKEINENRNNTKIKTMSSEMEGKNTKTRPLSDAELLKIANDVMNYKENDKAVVETKLEDKKELNTKPEEIIPVIKEPEVIAQVQEEKKVEDTSINAFDFFEKKNKKPVAVLPEKFIPKEPKEITKAKEVKKEKIVSIKNSKYNYDRDTNVLMESIKLVFFNSL